MEKASPPSSPPAPSSATTELPVSVLMERRLVRRGAWSLPQWRLLGVAGAAPGGSAGMRRRALPGADEDGARFLWSGLVIELFKDSGEDYWYNLVGNEPAVYVVCREDEHEDAGNELAPVLVTVSPGEAGAHVEADDTVLSAPMPPEVHQWLERYVVENYRPAERRVRKRRKWAQESEGGQARPPRRGR